MLITNIESHFCVEVIDYYIKSITLNKIERNKILNFINQCNKSIPDSVKDQSIDTKMYLTFTGSYQQKLVVCFDREHSSAESVRAQFETLYKEEFEAGDNSTKTLRISGLTSSGGDLTVSMFGIITDKCEDTVMVNV